VVSRVACMNQACRYGSTNEFYAGLIHMRMSPVTHDADMHDSFIRVT